MNKYPRIGRKKKPLANTGLKGGPCLVCSGKTTGRVEIQFTIFRGDDESARLCKECQRLPAETIIAAFQKKVRA